MEHQEKRRRLGGRLEGAWAALLAQLPLGPVGLASHPSAEPLLAVSLPGMGPRTSDAVARTAVSLAFLRAFKKQLVVPLLGAGVTTKEVVEFVVKPLAAGQQCLASRLPASAVGVPTAFVSHAWGSCHYGVASPACGCASDAGSFALLVESVSDFFAGAVDSEVFVWLDIFAVNQHDASGSELDGGMTLRKTVELAAHTLVVLERGSTLTLSRLWCLYEVGSAPPEKLQLLTRGFAPSELTAKFRGINVAAASCYDREGTDFDGFIRCQIRQEHGSQELFEQKLKLRLLLRPTSYEADLTALLANSSKDVWDFAELCQCMQAGDGVACIAGGPGEGKSTIAAALCRADNLVHAWHFCKASDITRQDVGEIIRSLAYQLATARLDATTLRFPAFAQSLLELDDAVLEQLGDHSKAFEVLLKKPLLSLPAGTRVVLLVDALDEAETPQRPVSKALSLLLDLGRLGVALSVVVTTRPEAVILDALQARWKKGFRSLLPGTLRSGGSEEPGESKLLRLLQSKVGGAAAAESVDDLYARFFTAVPTVDRELVDVLLAAREPPSLMLLEELGVRSQLEHLPGWGVLFYERDYCVHLLHRSLAEWLLAPERSGTHTANVASGHAAWVKVLTAQLAAWLDGGGRAPVSGHYLYRNVLAHLDECGRQDESRRLLMRLPWLQATLRERGVFALIREVAALSVRGDGTLDVLRRALSLSTPGLQGAGADVALLSQLVGRLRFMDGASAEVAQLVADALAWRGPVGWLCPVASTMRPPVGALEASLVGHARGVNKAAELHDGRLVSASYDCTLRIWNAATGECERVLQGHTADVVVVAVLRDGRVLSASGDSTLRIWNATTGECECVLEGHTEPVSSVAVLSDGRLVSSSWDKTLRIWNVASGACDRVLVGSTYGVTSVVVLGDGRVMSGSYDSTLRIWDAASGNCERILEGHTGGVNTLARLGDGRVISGSEDATARIWDLASGTCLRVLEGHTGSVVSVVVLGDVHVVTGSRDCTLRVWDTATGNCVHVLAGHRERVTFVAALDDERVVSGSTDMMLRIWNATSGACERVLEGHVDPVCSVAVLRDGRMVSTSGDNTLRIWNAATSERERAPIDGHTRDVIWLAVLDNGRIVSSSWDSTLRIWNTATGACERVLDGHTGWVRAIAVLGDGSLVSGANDNALRVWNAATGECRRVLEGHTAYVTSVAVLCEGRIASGSWDNTLRIWDVDAGMCERILEGHTSGVNAVAVLGDGRLASGSEDATVRVWNAATGECVHVLPDDSAEALELRSRPGLGNWDGIWRAVSAFDCPLPFVDTDGAVTCCSSETPDIGRVVAVAAGQTMHFLRPIPSAPTPALL